MQRIYKVMLMLLVEAGLVGMLGCQEDCGRAGAARCDGTVLELCVEGDWIEQVDCAGIVDWRCCPGADGGDADCVAPGTDGGCPHA